MSKIILVITLVGLASAVNYSTRVEGYFEDLQSKFDSSKTCVNIAKNKMKQFIGKYDADMQYAVALVNLYTQSCPIDGGYFYGQLNKNLRSGQPTAFWKTTEDLLNEGMVLLVEKNFPDVYRGCANKESFDLGMLYSFKQFLSTSLSKSVATGFASNILFNIKDALGVDVTEYSYYPNEKEVLLKSSSMFRVVNVTQEKGYRYVIMQYTDRVIRSDEQATEASFCDPDVPSSAPIQLHASVLLLAIAVIFYAISCVA